MDKKESNSRRSCVLTTSEDRPLPETHIHQDHTTLCPVDILKIIFEVLVETKILGFRYEKLRTSIRRSITISHVCARWRQIALDTPKLWVNISCSLERSFRKPEFWDCIHQRVKNMPVAIHLEDISLRSIDNLRICKIHEFPAIRALYLRLDSEVWSRLSEDLQGLSTTYIEEVTVRADQVEKPLISATFINYLNPHTLGIRSQDGFDMETKLMLPGVTHLHFTTIHLYYFTPVFTSFPNLRVLHISFQENFYWTSLPKTTFQLLEELHVANGCSNSAFWLRSVTAPILRTLSMYRPCDVGISFIKRHPSITSLKWLHGNLLLEISQIAPQIRHLVAGGNPSDLYQHMLNPKAPNLFPFLETLTIPRGIAFEDPGKILEDLIRTRCLPYSHSQSQLLPSIEPLKSLAVLYSYKTPREYIWAQRELQKDAKVEIFSEDRTTSFECDESTFRPGFRVVFSWV